MTGPAAKHAPTAEQDQQLELAIAMLLRIGVTVAALLVMVGGVIALRHPVAPVPDYTVFHAPGTPHSSSMHSISGVFRQLAHPSGPGIVAFGLLVLIATPIARVIFAMAGFARERDTLYTVISLIVLAILAFSLLHGS